MRRPLLFAAAVGACALTTAACGAAGGSAPPTWEPSPAIASEGPGVSISPIVPEPTDGAGNSGGTGSGSSGSTTSPGGPGPSTTPAADPNVVATKLTTPVGLALLPDGTALVGERTTGRILRVQPKAGQPTPVVKTITGLDTAGGGGLLDLAVSPDYAQDDLVYAYISTAEDNRVVDFTLDGPVTPVVTGIPHGSRDNAGRIVFDAAGDLLIGTGTAGSDADASKATSLAGKVLRVSDIGGPVSGNVRRGSPVWTTGHDGVAGLCPVSGTSAVLEVEPGRPLAEVNLLTAGEDYGYPSTRSGSQPALASLPASTPAPGDCAVLSGQLWVTSPDAQSLLHAGLTGSVTSPKVGRFTAVLTRKYGRLLTVVPAADGALWLTTTNRDGHGHPVAADERVIRYVPDGGGGGGGSKY